MNILALFKFSLCQTCLQTSHMCLSYSALPLKPDSSAFSQELIVLAIKELSEQVQEAKEEINERITGSRGGMGF